MLQYGAEKREERFIYDGYFDAYNPCRLFRPGCPAGRLVPETGGQRAVKEVGDMIVLGILVFLLGGYLIYALLHPEKF